MDKIIDNKMLFAVASFFNGYGVPSFLKGDVKKGIKTLVLGLVTLGILFIVNTIKGLMVAIEVIKMTDEEYAAKKGTIEVPTIPA